MTICCRFLLNILNRARRLLMRWAEDGTESPDIIIDSNSNCVVKFDAGVDKLSQIEFKVDTLMSSRQLYLDSNLTMETLAKEAGTNRTYLARMFKEKKRMRFEQYLNSMRLKYASDMAYRDLDVVDMAIVCGFPSLRAFYRCLLDVVDDEGYLLKKKYLCTNLYLDMADEKIIFSMNGVGKTLPANNKTILKDIYLSFFYGAKIGIIGLNGSGKSTLMKIIAGI